MNKENLVRAKFRIDRVLFPKSGELRLGEYSIIGCDLIECLTEGYQFKLNPRYENFSLLSNTPVIFNNYDEYTAMLEEVNNQYGTSYKLVELEREPDELTEGDKRTFLETVLTPYQVENLYKMYKNPHDIIAKKDKSALLKVKGIGTKTVEFLLHKYDKNLKYTKLITGLKQYNLSMLLMDKLLQKYTTPEKVIAKVKENPYILAKDINGIGFKKADAIAMNAGMSPTSPQRLEAFFYYYLDSLAEEGTSWLKPSVLFGQIEPMLGVNFSDDTIRETLYQMHDSNELGWNQDKTKIFLNKNLELEKNIFEELLRLKNADNNYTHNKEKELTIISDTEQKLGFELTDEQKAAVQIILDNNVSILTAFSGCGKTVLTKVFTSIFKSNGLSVTLCTLSGKASARIQEATGFEGSTIHRLLNYNPALGFGYNADNQLPYDVIIVDESSFVGGELFYNLIQSIKTGAKLILVGDDKQLPAIGMCNVFFDMINSDEIAIARLTQIHRQAQKSGIIVASKMVREGTQITKNGWTGIETRGELQDFTIDIYDNKLYGNPKIIEWYKHYVKNLQDTFKTQIIVPMKYRGDFNTFDLNTQIQNIYNPHSNFKKETTISKNGKTYTIREGDKVINRRNNYKATIYHPKEDYLKNSFLYLDEEDIAEIEDTRDTTEIFNGYCGEVLHIIDNKIIVKFDLCDKEIEFSYDERSNLELAYALTTHLFQGSQIENVICGLDNGSFIMNTKELVYTAITRASKECVLLAEGGALKHAINTSQTNNKKTFLKDLLQGNPI